MSETIRICPQCGSSVPADVPHGLCPKCVLAGAATATETGQPGGIHAEPPPLERIAAAFPHLQVLKLIGAGGMGAVFKARQPKLERFVALKVLPEALASDPAFAERFSREARTLARLNHPNIVTVYDFGQSGAFFYLLMEFVDGVNLRQAMRAGRFTPQQALTLVPKVCEALQFAHDEGILHRDIKPENILLDSKGRVKIADFGIAKLLGEPRPVTKLTATGAAVGTPNYMAPEQLEHPEDVDQRADIYSLGVVFYEMLTGELPIGRFAPPSEKTPVDPRVDAVVFRALEREREKRYNSASEVKTSVENIATTARPSPVSTEPAAAKHGIPPPVTSDWQRVWLELSAQTRLAAKIAIVVIAIALTYMFVIYRVDYVRLGSALVRTGNVGWGRPWLSFWRSPLQNMELGYGLDFFTFSFTAGLGAAASWILFARLRAAERLTKSLHGALTLSGEPPRRPARPNWVWPAAAVAFLLLFGLGASLLFAMGFFALRVEKIEAPAVKQEAVAANPGMPGGIMATRGVNAEFTLPGGQVATFEIVTRSNGTVVSIPNLSAYLIAREGEPASGRFRWVPDSADPEGLNKPWRLELTSTDGNRSGGSLDMPPAIAKAPGTISLWKRLEPDREFLEWAGNGNIGQPSIGLRIRTQMHGLKNGLSSSAAGTTNWLEAASRK